MTRSESRIIQPFQVVWYGCSYDRYSLARKTGFYGTSETDTRISPLLPRIVLLKCGAARAVARFRHLVAHCADLDAFRFAHLTFIVLTVFNRTFNWSLFHFITSLLYFALTAALYVKSFPPAFPALPETFGVNRPRDGCDASLFDLKLRVLAGNGILWGENAEDNSRKFSPAPLYGSACLMLERLFANGKLKKEEWP